MGEQNRLRCTKFTVKQCEQQICQYDNSSGNVRCRRRNSSQSLVSFMLFNTAVLTRTKSRPFRFQNVSNMTACAFVQCFLLVSKPVFHLQSYSFRIWMLVCKSTEDLKTFQAIFNMADVHLAGATLLLALLRICAGKLDRTLQNVCKLLTEWKACDNPLNR